MLTGAGECGPSEKGVNFELGFNDVDFSDRVLRLEITPAPPGNDSSVSAQKRRRTNVGGEIVNGLKVTTLNICSLLLAAKSPFFYKLFKNGMKESQKKVEFTLRIDESEEDAFMDMMNSIYHKPLNATSRGELMAVLIAADKYEVTSCMIHCVQLLLKLPMTTKSALFYLETIPSILFLSEETRPLIDAAKQFLSSSFSGFTQSQQEEAMSLPLWAIEAVLDTADFQVSSEEVVLDFILKWARAHYPEQKERREILNKRLYKFICFPCLSSLKLKEIVDCPDFDSVEVAKLAFNSLLYKTELPHGRNSVPVVNKTLLSNEALANCGFPRRAYYHRRVINFDLKKQDCAIMNSSRIYSEEFCVGGHRFSLFAQKQQKDSVEHFALFLEMRGSGSCRLSFELSAMKNPSKEFNRLLAIKDHTFTETARRWGASDLFKMPWAELMRDDGEYIIDGIIHLRAQLNINN